MTDPADLVVVPDQPDVQLVNLIHRGHDGLVCFAYLPPGAKWKELYGIPAAELLGDGVFEQCRPQLDVNAFFSLCGFLGRSNPRRSLLSPAGLELHTTNRHKTTVRYLTAVWADLDCYKLGRTYGQTVGDVIDAQDAGILPPASAFLRSGQGAWAIWILRDRHDDAPAKDWPAAGPVRAWNEKVELWATVQRVIGERLAKLGSDAAARDVTRVMRVPGSINAKVNVRVGYQLNFDTRGKPFVYTLNELADAVGARVRPMAAEVRAVNERLSAAGRRGAAGRWVHEVARFRILASLRPSWPVGMRNKAVWVFATILTSLRPGDRPSDGGIMEECESLWHNFDQRDDDDGRYTLNELRDTVNGVLAEAARGKRRKGQARYLRLQTIADRLDVTPEESKVCGYPPASRFSILPDLEPRNRAELAQQRRDALGRILAAQDGVTPPVRDLADMLLAEGINAAPATVAADLKAIGVTNPRARRNRRRRSARKSAPKLFPE